MSDTSRDEIAWLLDTLQLGKRLSYEVTLEDFQVLKIRRKHFILKHHPDKVQQKATEKDYTAMNARFNNAWDELLKRLPDEWFRQQAPDADTGARTSQASATPDTAPEPSSAYESDRSYACPNGPHVENFDQKYGNLASMKQQEYKFLYSAQAHCTTCMSFYSSAPGFNVKCTSANKTARGWAATATGRRARRAASIPEDVESWLRARDLWACCCNSDIKWLPFFFEFQEGHASRAVWACSVLTLLFIAGCWKKAVSAQWVRSSRVDESCCVLRNELMHPCKQIHVCMIFDARKHTTRVWASVKSCFCGMCRSLTFFGIIVRFAVVQFDIDVEIHGYNTK